MSGMSYKARRFWSIMVLVVGLPVYIVVAVNLVEMLDRPSFLVELIIFVVLGFLWMVPLKFVFKGVGKADPDAAAPRFEDDDLPK